MKRIFGVSNLKVALIMAAMIASSPIFSQTNKGGNKGGKQVDMASAHKVLVAYFSATGTTRGVAKTVAKCWRRTFLKLCRLSLTLRLI